jgi:hypothetical protein
LWAKHNGKNQYCLYALERKDEFKEMAEKIAQQTRDQASKGERTL